VNRGLKNQLRDDKEIDPSKPHHVAKTSGMTTSGRGGRPKGYSVEPRIRK